MKRLWRGIGLAGLAGLFLWPGVAAADNLEYAVKAAYLTKFVPFIAWPDGALASGDPVTLCVLGKGPFAGKLEQDAAAAPGAALAVRHVDGPDASCQLLFLDHEVAEPGAVLDALKNSPVVTVTDSDLPVHGIISFVITANHVRFDIDAAGAAARGLRISAKLLGLAHKVMLKEPAP
jgi:hypothetical protein